MAEPRNKRVDAILFAVSFFALVVGAKGIVPLVAHHAPFVIAVLVAAVFAGLLVAVTALAVRAHKEWWTRGALVSLACAMVSTFLYAIG